MPRSIDSRLDFLSPVSLIPGLGAKRSLALHESGIDTIGDLLHHFPLRYIDRSRVTPIADLSRSPDTVQTFIGVISKTRVERGRKTRLRIQISDDTGDMEALWFHGISLFRKILHTGMRVLCTGTVKAAQGHRALMFHPSLETIAADKQRPDNLFLPQYPLTAAMAEAHVQQKILLKAIRWALDNIKHWPQALPEAVERTKGFAELSRCMREMHVPSDLDGLHKFRARIIYEELYRLALALTWNKRKFAQPGRSLSPGALVGKLRGLLPFTLTQSQEEALTVLLDDAKSHLRMHRLLHGDVGCGKTVVAFFACLPALSAGLQVAWLVPTEALAAQAVAVFSPWCLALGFSLDMLQGSLGPAEKKRVIDAAASGAVRFLVGTHALLQPSVRFKKLGMIVIDEQHKFGAAQRLALQEKDPAADFLLMSATPIPQTLAQTMYGDLDVVSIASVPAGRKPLKTYCVPETKRGDMETFVREEITAKAAQVYYIVPRIVKDDQGEDIKDAQSVYQYLSCGPFAGLRCEVIHGKTDSLHLQRMVDDFKRGEIKVLVATTIVEVGIDAPEATIIIIENAERFGLAQLHQLRGRVGRSSKQSYCFMLADLSDTSVAGDRLSYFCSHHNGFEIAEMDLKLRGPGEVLGYRQTGADDLAVSDIIRDAELFQEIFKEVGRNFGPGTGAKIAGTAI